MIKTVIVTTIVTELNGIKRPKPNDRHTIYTLGGRKYWEVNKIKAFFKLLKKQKIESVLIDYSIDTEIKIVFNSGCSEYTIFNKPPL